MPITVNSPHSGRPVKIRDQDVGRAVRDEEGRIFYVLQRSDGQGYYSAMTRVGGPREEQRYLEMQEKMQTAREVGKQQTAQQIHDMTGKRRANPTRRLIVLVLLLIVAVAAVWLLRDQLPFMPNRSPQQPTPQQPIDGQIDEAEQVEPLPGTGRADPPHSAVAGLQLELELVLHVHLRKAA